MVIIEGVHPLAVLEIVFGIAAILLGILSAAGLLVFAIGKSFNPVGFAVLGALTLSFAAIGALLIIEGVRLRNQTRWTGTGRA